jgi:hypothetical protein
LFHSSVVVAWNGPRNGFGEILAIGPIARQAWNEAITRVGFCDIANIARIEALFNAPHDPRPSKRDA